MISVYFIINIKKMFSPSTHCWQPSTTVSVVTLAHHIIGSKFLNV